MSRTPRVGGLDLVSALGRAGFVVVRVRGSYHFVQHDDGGATVVPVHSGETIGPGLLNKVLRDCKIDADQLRRLLLG